MVINWLDLIWHKLTLGGISEQSLSQGHFPLVELSLARLFNSHWHNYATVAGTSIQQSLTRLFNSHWHDCSTVAGTVIQKSLARLFNSHWHNYATVAGTSIQQSLTRLFNGHWHDCSKVTGTILCWQNSSTVLKNRAMYQEYATGSSRYI